MDLDDASQRRESEYTDLQSRRSLGHVEERRRVQEGGASPVAVDAVLEADSASDGPESPGMTRLFLETMALRRAV